MTRRTVDRWIGLVLAAIAALLCAAATAQPSGGETLESAAAARAEALGRPVRAAIFVKNRGPASLDQELRGFEDLLVARMQRAGIELISPEDTVTAINRFLREGDDRVRDRLRSADDTDIDRILNENTSALRLAQDMGADYLMVVSLVDYGRRVQPFRSEELGINRTAVTHQLRAAFKVLSIGEGAAVLADDVVVRTRENQVEGALDELRLGDLMADASGLMADRLSRAIMADVLPEPEAIPMSRFIVQAAMQDLMVPEVIENDEGELILGANRYQVEALAVDVLINGSFVGTTGQVIEVPAGFHVMRLEREGFTPWERRVKLPEIAEDEPPAFFQTALAMNDRGLARFREMTAMFQDLKEQQRLNAAEIERIEAIGQLLRQSGLRVDLRHASDVAIGWQRDGRGPDPVAAAGAMRSVWRRMFPADEADRDQSGEG